MGAIVLAVVVLTLASPQAEAIPLYARQTGQSCGTCHTDFPALTPFGRRFKLGGYTALGGNVGDPWKPETHWTLPVSMMAIGSFTHTAVPNPGLAGGPPDFGPNDNVHLDAVSLFGGGAITENIGAFIQATYNQISGPNTTGARQFLFHWDNVDLRYANTVKAGGLDILFGLTVHNNPTVQDVWNNAPAWGFPFTSSAFAAAAGPAFTPATTILDGTFAQQVIGVGGYAFINDMLYLEATGYQTLGTSTLATLGIDQTGSLGTLDRVSPYFRVAFEPHWDTHWLELGAFAFLANVNPQPWIFAGAAGTDQYTDLGADVQYQFQGDHYWITLRGLYIHEDQQLNASSSALLGLASNASDQLNTFRAQASLAYGDDNRIVLTGGYFNTWGTPDVNLYGGSSINNSPNTDGYVAEIAYIPFGLSKPGIWPWFNLRLGAQYVWYNKFFGASTNFDGAGTNASDNNMFLLYAWAAW